VGEVDSTGAIPALYIHGPGIDEPLAIGRPTGTFAYHADGLGSIITLTDLSGNPVRSYTYDSFGRIVAQTGTLANFYTYTGREFDPESGLLYYRARYYDPSIGRFLGEDPLAFKGVQINLYSYVENNPVNAKDPRGLQTERGCDCPGGMWSGSGGSVGGILGLGGRFSGIYRLSCWSEVKSCWIMTTCTGLGAGLGGSLSVESIWIGGATNSSDISGRTGGGVAFGGAGITGVGGGASSGPVPFPVNPPPTPVPPPPPSSSVNYGAGLGLGGGYIVGACETVVLSCN